MEPPQLALDNTNNLSSQLINNKLDKIEKINKSGIYKLSINCSNCDTIYIGQTGRSFKKRYKEHEGNIPQTIKKKPTLQS